MREEIFSSSDEEPEYNIQENVEEEDTTDDGDSVS
jgi:hypothetical protein